MANTFQIKRGTDLSNAGTPAAGEPVWNSSTSKLYIGDGSTAASSLSQVGSEFLPLAGGAVTGDITLSGAKLLVAASMQGIFGASDGDTGIRWEGDDVLAIDTDGSERVTIASNGTSTFKATSGYPISSKAVDDADDRGVFLGSNGSGTSRLSINVLDNGGWRMYDYGSSTWNVDMTALDGNMTFAGTIDSGAITSTAGISGTTGTFSGNMECNGVFQIKNLDSSEVGEVSIRAGSGANAILIMESDNSANNDDTWKFQATNGGTFSLYTTGSGSWASILDFAHTTGNATFYGGISGTTGTFSSHVDLAYGSHIKFEGSGGNTSIGMQTNSPDTLEFNMDGTAGLYLTASSATFAGELSIPQSKKLYLDGGGDTYLWSNGSNTVDLNIGGTNVLQWTAANFSVEAGNAIFAGNVTTSGAGSSVQLGDKTTNGSPYISFQGSNSAYNWRLRQNDVNGGDFTIKRSTATGGSTWESTPALQITSDQNAKFAEELTCGDMLTVEDGATKVTIDHDQTGLAQYNAGEPTRIRFQRSRGSNASPTAVADTDVIGQLWYQPYAPLSGGQLGFRQGAGITSTITGAISNGVMKTDLKFYTTTVPSVPTLALTLGSDLSATFGGDVVMPSLLYHAGDSNTQLKFESSKVTLKTSGGQSIRLDSGDNTYIDGMTSVIIQTATNDTPLILESTDQDCNLIIKDDGSSNGGMKLTASNNDAKIGTNNETVITLDTSQNTHLAGNLYINKADGQFFLQNGSGTNRAYIQYQESPNDLIIASLESGSDIKFQPAGNNALILNDDLSATFAGDIFLSTNNSKIASGAGYQTQESSGDGKNLKIGASSGQSSGDTHGGHLYLSSGARYGGNGNNGNIYLATGSGSGSYTDTLTLDGSNQSALFAGSVGIAGQTGDATWKLNVGGRIRSTDYIRMDHGGVAVDSITFADSGKDIVGTANATLDTSGNITLAGEIINRVPTNGTGIIRMSGATDDSEGFFLRHNHVGGSGASAGNFQIGRRWGGSDPSAGAGYAMQITGGYVTTFNGSVGVGGTHTPGQPLDVRIDQNSDTVARVYNNTAGTSAAAAVRLKTNSALGLLTVQDDGYSTSGMYIADGMSIFAADGASGGLLLGTEGDDPVLFYQDRTEKARIHTNGNVGIGTSTPDFLLDVESTGTPTLCVRNSAASADAKIIIGEPNTTAYGLEMKWKGSTGCAYFDNRYDHSSNPHMYFRMKTSGTPITALTINPAGNVGIGATPLYPLHVNTSTDKNLMVRDSVAPTGGVMLQSVNDADSAATAMELRGSLFSFQVGNVGIGVTDPDNVLEVNGDISTSTHNQAIMARYGTSNNYAALLGWSSVADGAILQLGNNNANNEIRAGHQSTGGGLKIITNNTADYTAAHNGTVALAFTSAGVATFGGNVLPSTDNSKDLGSSSLRWANIYVGDMHLKNDRGDWTVIEEEDYLSLKNNKNGKTYKLVMEEV